MDAGQREMPEREPHVPPKLLFYLLDHMERLPRVRALVIAVLDDQAAGGRAADVIDLLVQRRWASFAVLLDAATWLFDCPESSGHQGERPPPGSGDFQEDDRFFGAPVARITTIR